MSYFEFPHTRSYDGDLGYIIKRLDELTAKYGEFMEYNTMKFADPVEWSIARQYEAWTLVFDVIWQEVTPGEEIALRGYNLYMSIKPVPKGINIHNEDYWQLVLPFTIDTELNIDSDNVVTNHAITSVINTIENHYNALYSSVENEIEARTNADTTMSENISTNTSNITSLGQRLDELTSVITPGSTTGDAELIDIRTGANGITYDNAGNAVRGQFTELDSDIYSSGLSITWEQGGFNNNTGAKITSASQIRTAAMFTVSKPVFIKIASGFRYYVYKYSTLADFTSFVSPAILRFESNFIMDNGYYAIAIQRLDGTNITPDAQVNININTDINNSLAYNSFIFNDALREIHKTMYPTFGWTAGKGIVSGSIYGSVNFDLSDPIYIKGDDFEIITSLSGAAQIGLFDPWDNIIQTWGVSDGTLITGTYYKFNLDLGIYTDKHYIRVTSYLGHAAVTVKRANVYDRLAGNLAMEIRKNNSRFLDKKVLIMGDSISTGQSSYASVQGQSYGNYDKWVDLLIDDNFFNKGTIVNDSIHATGFIPKLAVADGGAWLSGENNFNQRLDYYINNDLADTFDLVVLFGGINDYLQSIPLGNGNDDYTTYFKAAVNHYFENLVNNFTNAHLMVILPLRTPSDTNSDDIPFTDYYDHIRDTAKKYSIPCFDAGFSSSFYPANETFKTTWTYNGDGVHPNYYYNLYFLKYMLKGFIDNG